MSMRNLKKNRGNEASGNLYITRKELDFFKQSKKASEHIIREGSLGLSSKAETAFRTLMKAFTDRDFKGVNLLTGEQTDRDDREERIALYGKETGLTLESIPRLQFRKESDLVRLLTGRKTGEPTGSDYRDYKAIKEELTREAELVFYKEEGGLTHKYTAKEPLFIIASHKVETSRTGEQEVLFQEEVVLVTIQSRVLIHEITAKGKTHTLPVDSTQLLSGLKEEQKLTKRQERLIEYLTVLREAKHSYKIEGKKVFLSKFTEDFLLRNVMRVPEKSLLPENRNRSKALKELEEALKVCEHHETIERIEYDKGTKTVKVFFVPVV
jgi:hypothetical protein